MLLIDLHTFLFNHDKPSVDPFNFIDELFLRDRASLSAGDEEGRWLARKKS